MYILDKNKDFYDYLSGIYGVDKTITYDRRGSTVLTEKTLLNLIVPTEGSYREHYKNNFVLFILEVGDIQYLIMVNEIKFKKDTDEYYWGALYPVEAKFRLFKTFMDHKHYFEKEITLVPVRRLHTPFTWREKKFEVNNYSELEILDYYKVSNPIMKNTSIPSIIDATEVWKNLNNYISSKYNDKTITIVNSDVDKAVNHGFDKKTSFRHPIK